MEELMRDEECGGSFSMNFVVLLDQGPFEGGGYAED
jgi:hypothetical protein